jgi:hypothetical protein
MEINVSVGMRVGGRFFGKSLFILDIVRMKKREKNEKIF